MSPVIALTTDFGPSSAYVAQMKGVLLSSLPGVQIVDVTHAVPPQSIRHAEVVLRGTAFTLPLGTVHIVVVDPGVGTSRRPLAVEARGLCFVGPDNGVLGFPLAQPGARAVHLDRPELFRHPVSSTFHGRDLFSPVAAELAAGLPLTEVGSPVDDALPSQLPAMAISREELIGEVLCADSFGNLTTNIPAHRVEAGRRVKVAGQMVPWLRTYGDGPVGELLALASSDGYVEIAVREGSAAELFGEGAEVVCTRGG